MAEAGNLFMGGPLQRMLDVTARAADTEINTPHCDSLL